MLFSLLYEFSHICIGENSLFNDRDSTGKITKAEEMICNAVAVEILVPKTAFAESWNSVAVDNDIDKIETLAKQFKCGSTVIARKAYDSGFIDFQLYQRVAQKAVQFYNESKQREKDRCGNSGDFSRTAKSRIDQRFFRMLADSVQEGKTLYSDAFRLTNINRTVWPE